MSTVLWIAQGVLAAVFLLAGSMKLIRSRDELAGQMGWVEDVGEDTPRLVGILEVLAAIGLILPAVTGIAVVLTPIAALGLALVQIGAIRIHLRRKEGQMIVVNSVLIALSLLVAGGRFGPYPLS
ncbi:MAG: DoxX family protein [Acidimicrobiia bacterium]|jgi:uncharacterized membrane protein YphA (DoxX/SURF4 family)